MVRQPSNLNRVEMEHFMRRLPASKKYGESYVSDSAVLAVLFGLMIVFGVFAWVAYDMLMLITNRP